jgi:hypothetical protein
MSKSKSKTHYQEGKSQLNQDNTGKGFGISGQNPGKHQGPVAGGADNTRGQNVTSREGSGGGAKHGKENPERKSPQGSNTNFADTRGSDSTDKEFRNNQPNASTLQGHKGNSGPGTNQK